MGGIPEAPLLVGRSAETKTIDSLVDELAEHRGSTAVIFEGEAGIGKTSLLAHMVEQAARADVRVLYGVASALDKARPFGPLLDALLVEPPGDRETIPAPVRTAIERVRETMLASPAPRLSPLQQAPEQRSAMVEGLVALAQAWGAAGPTIIALDDLHEADLPTLSVLALLSRRVRETPIVVVATARLWPRAPELADLFAAWSDEGATTLGISGLSDAEVDQLLEHLTGAPPDPQLSNLAGSAEGNPFLVMEMVLELRDQARIDRSDGTAKVDLSPDADVLSRAGSSIVTRMARLGAEATALLQTAALLGRDFSVGDLAIVVDAPVASLTERLVAPLNARLIVERGGLLHFQHELVREAIANTIPPGIKSDLQLDIARRLRAAGIPVNRLASLYLDGARVGDREAIDALAEAAAAIVGTDPTTAAELLERAIGLTPAGDPYRGTLAASLADALLWSGRAEAAAECAEQALRLTADGGTVASLHENLARSLAVLGRTNEALEQLDHAKALTASSRWATASAGVIRVFSLEFDAAVADAEWVLRDDAADPRDPWAEAVAETVLSWVENARGYFDLAAERCTNAVTVANESPGLELHRMLPYLFAGVAHINAGREEVGVDCLRRGRAIAEQLGTVYALPFYHYAEGQSHWTSGRLDDLLAECEAGLRCASDHNSWLGAPYAHAMCGGVHLFQGRLDDAASSLDSAEALLAQAGAQFGLDWAVRFRGLWLEATDELEVAMAVYDGTLAVARGMQSAAVLSMIGPDMIRMQLAMGDEESARATYDEMASSEGGNRTAVDLLLLRCRGMLDRRADLVERARQAHLGLGWNLEVVADEEALVLTHLRADAPEQAKASLRASLQACAEHGLPMIADRVRREAERRGVRMKGPAPRRPTFGWESITDTERTVIGLVAEGLTNPQIAAKLGCSGRTVESHLNRVYRKVGVANRTELAVAVVERGGIRSPG